MRRGAALLAAIALVAAVPLAAAYRLVPKNAAVAVAKSALTVTPSVEWNRLTARPGRNAESWTRDGLLLNDVTFYGGIADDATLFREVDKKERPLPRFSLSMLPPDIALLFEGSYRVAIGTTLFAMDGIEPATFAGQPGFRFTYSFTVQNEDVRRQGEARGAIIGGKLYMMTYEAPALHYFARDRTAFAALADSARLADQRSAKRK